MKRRGSSTITMPIAFGIIFVFTIATFVLVVKLITPFIIYQKIDNVITKYIYVVEKFGYLTENEKNNLLLDLSNEGISSDDVTLEYPKIKEPYGNLISLKVNYRYTYKMPSVSEKGIEVKNKETIISIEKNSFSKIY